MKKIFFSCISILAFSFFTRGQVGIGTGSLSPDSSAMLEIKSNSKGFLPPRLTTSQRDAITNPAIGLMIFNTSSNCLELYAYGKWQEVFCSICTPPRVSPIEGLNQVKKDSVIKLSDSTNGGFWTSADTTIATVDTAGIVKGKSFGVTVVKYTVGTFGCTTTVSKQISVVPPFSIGQSYGGGIIVYIDSTGIHGLIVATSDQSSGIKWSPTPYTYIYSGVGIGGGIYGTNNMISAYGTTTLYSATICRNYRGGNYTDWYLPNGEELDAVYAQRNVIGGFSVASYWISDNYDVSLGQAKSFDSQGGYTTYNKGTSLNVRAVRKF